MEKGESITVVAPACSPSFWGIVSSIFYVLGGALFIAGSVYVVPGLSTQCVLEGCSIDVALWYLVGCVFYFLAAVIDLSLQIIELRQKGTQLLKRRGRFRFNQFTESFIASWIYLLGSILFLVGSAMFFPALNATIPARLTFRAGSCMYILGSSYGIMQLVFPSGRRESDDDVRRVRRMTMTRVESTRLFPNTEAVTDFGSEAANSYHRPTALSEDLEERTQYCGCCPSSVLIGVAVKVCFICGSSSFLTGGILFGYGLIFEGGYLWLGGSFLFLFGSLVSIANLFYERHRKSITSHQSLPSSIGDSSQSSNSADEVDWDRKQHDVEAQPENRYIGVENGADRIRASGI